MIIKLVIKIISTPTSIIVNNDECFHARLFQSNGGSKREDGKWNKGLWRRAVIWATNQRTNRDSWIYRTEKCRTAQWRTKSQEWTLQDRTMTDCNMTDGNERTDNEWLDTEILRRFIKTIDWTVTEPCLLPLCCCDIRPSRVYAVVFYGLCVTANDQHNVSFCFIGGDVQFLQVPQRSLCRKFRSLFSVRDFDNTHVTSNTFRTLLSNQSLSSPLFSVRPLFFVCQWNVM